MDVAKNIFMKKVSFWFWVILLTLYTGIFQSCVSTHKAYQSSPVIARNVELDPIKADIVVDESKKLIGSSSSFYFLFFRIGGDKVYADGIAYSTDTKFTLGGLLRGSALNKVRSSAAYKALQTGDYDVLVHPTYEMKTLNFLWIFRKYSAKASGYGAKYNNFRTERQMVVITNSGKEYVFPAEERFSVKQEASTELQRRYGEMPKSEYKTETAEEFHSKPIEKSSFFVIYSDDQNASKPIDGEEAYSDYLKRNTRLSAVGKCINSSTNVVLRFYVGRDGKPFDIQVVGSSCADIEKEAVRLVKEGPAWTRGGWRTKLDITF
jgi:hypothetical protein